MFALHQAETGVTVAEVCRKLGVSEATFYSWKKKYSGFGPVELRWLRQLEVETTGNESQADKPLASSLPIIPCLRPPVILNFTHEH